MSKPTLIIGGMVLLGMLGAGLVLVLQPQSAGSTAPKASLGAKQPYAEIANPSGFLNTPPSGSGQAGPITIGELVGKKVILVDFMTYSCINCQRTFPHVRNWYEKYKDKGLEIVGIHTPEFAFEKDINNVRIAMKEARITYPVVLDNDYGTWRAWGNQYWPRKYLIDINGNVVYDHIGEGAYEETEMKIRELLEERASVLGENKVGMDKELAVSNVPIERNVAQSPETYFGSSRNEYFANGTSGRQGEQTFSLPQTPSRNSLYLGGSWNIMPEYAESVSGGSVVYKYNAKEVYIVADADTPMEIEVLQDGKPIGTSRGADVDTEGFVMIKESRLYKLIRNATPGEHVLELKVGGKGIRFYAFTFG